MGRNYPTALRRVQIKPKTSTNITRYLNSRGDRSDRFSRNAPRQLGLKLRKKNGGQFKLFFSDNEESGWLANINFSLLDIKSEEKRAFPGRTNSLDGQIVWQHCRRLVHLDGQIVLENRLSRRPNIRRFVRRRTCSSRLHIRRFVRLRRFVRSDDLFVL